MEEDDRRLERVPPHSMEAETALLGSCLLDRRAIDMVGSIVSPGHFYRPAHEHIYSAILALHQASQPVDLITLKEELARAGVLDKVGGAHYIAELTETVPSASNAPFYARTVRERALLRDLIRATMEIQNESYAMRRPTNDILDGAEQRIFSLTRKRVEREATPIAEAVDQVLEVLRARMAGEEAADGLMTGFTDLDDKTHGLQPGSLVIVAARPSMGKTTLALNLLRQICMPRVNEGRGAALFSMEMPVQQIVENLLCCCAGVDAHRMRGGFFSEQEYDAIFSAGEVLAEQRVFIDDSPGLSTMQLRAKARRLVGEHDIDLVIVDYLQLMKGATGTRSRQEEVSEISRSLKELARELEVPVIALSQLSRKVESREDFRPRLSDLRESGAIEQDADLVLLLHREEYYHRDKEEVKNLAQIIVAKNRLGPPGEFTLTFLKDRLLFRNYSQ